MIVNGKIKESGNKEIQDLKTLGIKQYYYAGKVTFIQPIVLKAKVRTSITGSVTYQACTAEMCLPPKTVEFSARVE